MSLVATRRRREVEPSGDDVPVTRETYPKLYCRAHGCPLRWSVSTADITACSYHAWAKVEEWPWITERLRAHGPWKLVSADGNTPTVRDMKTRLKGRLHAPEVARP